MLSLRNLTIYALFAGLVVAVGCTDSTGTDVSATQQVATVAAVNANCPIMGKPVKDDGGCTDWNGQTIGFCCPKCVDKWDELSEEDKTSHLADAAHSNDNVADDHSGTKRSLAMDFERLAGTVVARFHITFQPVLRWPLILSPNCR